MPCAGEHFLCDGTSLMSALNTYLHCAINGSIVIKLWNYINIKKDMMVRNVYINTKENTFTVTVMPHGIKVFMLHCYR